MKHTAFALRLLALLAAMLLLACGCASNASLSADTIVATVGNTTITLKEYAQNFAEYYRYYTSQNFDITSEDSLRDFRMLVLDEMINSALLYEKSLENGTVLSQEEKDAIAAYTESTRQSLTEAYQAQAQEEGAADAAARGEALLNAAIQEAGFESMESYLLELEESARRYQIVETFKAEFAKDITVPEEDVHARYEADLKEQQETFDKTPAQYETAQSQYDYAGGVPPVYVPADYIRVKHILVGDLETANQLLEELNAGADFDELMAEHGTDPGMKAEPNMSLGYLMSESTGFVQEFKDAAFALTNIGDLSQPVQSMHGYHIIRLESVIKAGAVPYETVKDAYTEFVLTDAKSEALATALERWLGEASIQRHTAVINNFTMEMAEQY